MLIIARPARLLECLEFDPEDFYNHMIDVEGEMRSHIYNRINQYGPPIQQAQQQISQPVSSSNPVNEMGESFLNQNFIKLYIKVSSKSSIF